MTDYKLLSKKENEKGVVLRFEVRKTSWLSWFGLSSGPKIEEIEVFYPISNNVHFTTDMAYMDGLPVPLMLQSRLKNLLEIASFRELPATKEIADDSA